MHGCRLEKSQSKLFDPVWLLADSSDWHCTSKQIVENLELTSRRFSRRDTKRSCAGVSCEAALTTEVVEEPKRPQQVYDGHPILLLTHGFSLR